MATRWKYMARAFGSGALMRPKPHNSAEAMTACLIAAARRQQTTLTPSSLVGLLAAHPFHWINTGARSRLAPWTALTLANGSSATVSRSIGRITPEACTAQFSMRPNLPGAAYGRAATFNRGCTASASEPVADRPLVRMTRTRIPNLTLGRRRVLGHCQSACKIDPRSASNFDPLRPRVLTVALAASELVGVAETLRARVGT